MNYKKIKLLFFLCFVMILLSGCSYKESKYNTCIDECCKRRTCKDNLLEKDDEGKYIRTKCGDNRTYCADYDQACRNICVEKYK